MGFPSNKKNSNCKISIFTSKNKALKINFAMINRPGEAIWYS